MFIVLSLFTLYLFMMGYALTAFPRAGSGHRFEQVALTLSVGILINYCLMLTGLTHRAGLHRWNAPGDVGRCEVFQGLSNEPGPRRTGPFRRGDDVRLSVGIVYILGVYYLVIFSEPLLHWDARSIWFFHAKMIWTEGALRQQHRLDPSIAPVLAS